MYGCGNRACAAGEALEAAAAAAGGGGEGAAETCTPVPVATTGARKVYRAARCRLRQAGANNPSRGGWSGLFRAGVGYPGLQLKEGRKE